MKNVLTAKKGYLLGVLAGKQGFRAKEKDDFFEFFLLFWDRLPRKPLIFSNLRDSDPSKKNRA